MFAGLNLWEGLAAFFGFWAVLAFILCGLTDAIYRLYERRPRR